MAGGVSSVYLHVIEDVISKVRDEFVNSGGGESVLSELQAIWETKMMQCGVISPNMERPSLHKPMSQITPVHDLNVPAEEYETPTADMLFPPTPLQTPVPQTPIPQTPIQTPLMGSDQMYNISMGSSDFAPANDSRNGGDAKTGRPNPYMQPPSPWINQRPLGVDVNVAYVEGRDEIDRALHQPTTQDFFMMSSGKRKRDEYPPHLTPGGYMPQQDGSGDIVMEFLLPKESQISSTRIGGKRTTDVQSSREMWAAIVLPQQDGVHDDYDDLFHFQGVANEVYNTPTPAEHVELRAPTPSVSTPKLNKGEAVEDDEPPLNEDDDDDDDDDLDDFDLGEEEPNTQHLVLAQFDKVTRTKSRWKCTLKDGIMHINSRDILFNKANGEFDF